MTRNVIWQDHEPVLQPVDETVDHVRGSPAGPLILEYGDYECLYSRQAFRAIERVEQDLGGGIRFCFRHFPLTGIHPHALAAAAAAEAAARQGRFWDMHAMLFHRQKALEDDDLRRYATALGLDVPGSSCPGLATGTVRWRIRARACRLDNRRDAAAARGRSRRGGIVTAAGQTTSK